VSKFFSGFWGSGELLDGVGIMAPLIDYYKKEGRMAQEKSAKILEYG